MIEAKRQMRVLVSMPMKDREQAAILQDYNYAKKMLEDRGYEVVSNLFDPNILKVQAEARGVLHEPLYCLSKSLELLSACDAILMCPGWDSARGCRIEREAARAYGLKIMDYSYFDATPITYN